MATLEELKAQLAALQKSPSKILPSPVQQDQDDDSDDDNTSSNPADLLAKVQALKANPTPNAPPVGDIISKLTGKSDQELADAQAQRNRLQLLTGLGQAGSTIGQAFQTLSPKQDYSQYWNNANNLAEQPITDLKEKEIGQKNAVQQNILENQAKTESNQTDPDSGVSKAMRDLYQQETGKKADPNLTYSDISKLEPSLARMFLAHQNLIAHQDANRARGDEKQNAAIKDTQTMIETARGSKDVQNARETTRLIDNAQSLLKEYPDLNKMPASQVALFAQEMGKIAKGGVAGESEVSQIMPQSLASSIMKGLGQLENKPNGAQLGAFLKEYQPYLNTIRTNSNQLINDRTDRILKAQAPRLGEQNLALLKSIYTPSPIISDLSKTKSDNSPAKQIEKAKPKVVTQNGHTYTLNEETGKYE